MARYRLHSMNAFIDGLIINDFESDEEAERYAADYEARCYRLEDNGSATLIYWPGKYDGEEAGAGER